MMRKGLTGSARTAQKDSTTQKQIEAIRWMDHWGPDSSGWLKKDELTDLEPVGIVTVGWVVKEDDMAVVVCYTWPDSDEVDQYLGGIRILKGCIVERKKLKLT